ncbi:long-chain fatty acid--CoA ligase [Mesosutterella sp. AGMB02718]|uniref:Long-chain fatty acid--CoA ligase n=1 Tax=Mesosutterella faecium TaxID=2925194 RepID=A0ABT7IMG5_9BURK|nr:long-chain fatty acid--CoA ligase [Mesosutterella sp. AGMB02718]MDL2059561.1 long-chain fatty acid--CoA ligase [Mesosutterella sp. AGMB02718]
MDQPSDTIEARLRSLELVQTLPELLTQHIPCHARLEAFREYSSREKRWVSLNYEQMNERVQRWREAFAAAGLERGDRCAMLMPNCVDAICFDQGVLSDAFVPVPLHAIDTPGSSAYILQDSGCRVLVTNKYLKWKGIRDCGVELPDLKLVVITDDEVPADPADRIEVIPLETFLERGRGTPLPPGPKDTDLGAIVYTSGTTGRPKGVMLTHRNILSNVRAVLKHLQPEPTDRWFSFLPLSHTFERTTTYYVGMGMGNPIIFYRSIATLAKDLKYAAPNVMMAVPRVYEQIYAKIMQEVRRQPKAAQALFNWAVDVGWRRFCRENGLPAAPGRLSFLDPIVAGPLDRLVGAKVRSAFGEHSHINVFVSGGAALNPVVARCLLGLGVTIVQGYGMTEASPIITVHKKGAIHPTTVGPALPNLEVKLGEDDELLVRGPSIMKGYWHNQKATDEAIDSEGWLHTGDVAEIYEDGQISIKGRIKEIIVTSTGEKVPPADLEQAIEVDPFVDQVMVIGDDRPYIAAIIVPNRQAWEALCAKLGVDPADPATLRARPVRQAVVHLVKAATRSFPNYGIPRDVLLTLSPWTIDNGALTPTLKLKRRVILQRLNKDIEELYGSRE